MKEFFRFTLILSFLLCLVFLVAGVNDLQCFFIQNTTCPSTTTRLIGLENDSEGFNNAHAQNRTFATYNYSICCNNTNSSILINSTCPGNVTVVRLSNATNAHVEIGTNTNYSFFACLGSSWKKVDCTYPTGSCSTGTCILSMAGSEGSNTTNAHVGNCSAYNQKVCCGLSNSAPIQPILYYPVHNNDSVFERKPNFNWSIATDPDGDIVDYTLNISCTATASCDCNLISISSLSTTNYTISAPLCVDTPYNWTVTACDVYNDCNTSNVSNFTVKSTAELVLIANTTNFGSMSPGQNDNTTDDNPTPLVGRNTGNVLINVTINATNLFSTVAMNTEYYQFKADQNETGSYNASCSQNSTFANMDNVTQKVIFCNMSYEDSNDEGELELNVTIPTSEPPGNKTSTIELTISQSEH